MKKKSAIVVDDSKSARYALRKLLEARSFGVQAVEGAEECYALLTQSIPDVIFMDQVMPGIDGFDALRHLRADKHTAEIPVIICSSHGSPDFIAKARSLGATDVLMKPPSPEQIDRVLEELDETAIAKAATAAAARSTPVGQRVISAIRSTLVPPARRETPADIGAQIAELRTQAAQLEQKLAQEQQPATMAMDPQSMLRQLLQRMDVLEHKVDTRLNQLQHTLETGLRQQSERIVRITEAARSAAVENAHVEAERTVAQAASHISDQFVNSLVSALRGGSFKPSPPPSPARSIPPEKAARQKA